MGRNQRWRDEFIARMSRAGMPLDVTRKLLRAAATLQRLAEAQCNGDWPADNGQRETSECDKCAGWWAPSVLKRPPELSKRAPKTLAAAIGTGYVEAVDTGGILNTFKVPKWCPDCRTEARVRALLLPRFDSTHDAGAWAYAPKGDGVPHEPRYVPSFAGDPRGAVLSVRIMDSDNPREREEGVGVPS